MLYYTTKVVGFCHKLNIKMYYVYNISVCITARKRNGVRPSHFCRSSSGIARKVLQSLEQMKLIEKVENNNGRRLTSQGRRDLDRIAAQVKQAKKKKQALLAAESAGFSVLIPKTD